MDKIFHVYATNGPDRDAELSLPATPYQIQDAFDKLRLEPGKLPYLDILDYREEYSYLERCIQKQPDIFQLNALAKKLSELSTTASMASFEGLVGIAMKKGALPVPLSRLIDFAYSMDCCHIIGDAVTDYALGRFLAENEFVPEAEGLSGAAFELLNFATIGREHREAEGGIYTGFGYVEQHSELRQVHKTLDITPKKPAYTILAETFDETMVEFPFPANTPMGTEPVRCVDCAAPSLIGLTGGMETVDLLARRLAGLEPKALSTYKALLEATDCKDIQSAEALMDSLDEYIFSPQYSSPIEVAKGELSAVLCDEDAATLIPHLNLYQYGQALIERCGGSLTAYGLIEREDHQPVQAIENMPSQGGMEML